MRYVFAFTLSLAIPAPGIALANADLSGVKTVAIVSAIGRAMNLQRREFYEVPIEDWQLDEHVENELRSLLSKRFEVRQVSNLPQNLAGCRKCVDVLPRTSEVDAYILISTGDTKAGVGPGDEYLGIGIRYLPRMWEADKTVVHAIYDFSVVEARTGRVLDSEESRLPEAFSWGEHYKTTKELSGAPWPSDGQHMTADQKKAVRDAVFSLMDESLPYMVQYMNLGGN